MRILSLGAGVQSSTLALMMARGEIEPVEAAVFADVQTEPAAVYTWLDWLEKQLPFPVHRVTKGNLGTVSTTVRTSKLGNKYTKAAIPAFITDGVKTGLAMRQCTEDFKINVIYRTYQQLRQKRDVVQVIGISLDEYRRMKPARKKWVTNDYPLVDRRLTRLHCLEWMQDQGYPMPPRSACYFCPYHSDDEWRRLKTDDPVSFGLAVAYERDYQQALAQVTKFRGVPYLHRSLKPLSEVDFADKSTQTDMFNNECEGVCGV